MRAFLFAASLILPVSMFAHSIVGTYSASGFDPLTGKDYTGVVVISKDGAVYTAQWTFPGGSTDVGTGVRNDDVLSFVFNENETISFGVQSYEIGDGTLHGPWVRFDADKRGFEKLKKI